MYSFCVRRCSRAFLPGQAAVHDTSILRAPPPIVLSLSFCSSTSESVTCWKCGRSVEADQFFCGCSKHAVLPANPQRDYFSLLNCEREFSVDTARLQATFRNLQTQLHPDKFSNQPSVAQNHSADQSSLVNAAFQTLQSPLSRALYLLELNGMPIEDGTTSMDQTFLMHVMDLNDSLDGIETEDDLREFMPSVEELIEGCTSKAAVAFDAGDIAEAREQICQLKYFVNLQRRAKEKLLGIDIASG